MPARTRAISAKIKGLPQSYGDPEKERWDEKEEKNRVLKLLPFSTKTFIKILNKSRSTHPENR